MTGDLLLLAYARSKGMLTAEAEARAILDYLKPGPFTLAVFRQIRHRQWLDDLHSDDSALD